MKIIPNEYLDLTIPCDQCGFPVANAKTRLAKRCCMPGVFHPKNKSPCQKSADRESAKKTRGRQRRTEGKLYQNKALDDKSQEALRECLRCEPNEDGSIPTFLSKGPYNRICERCSNKEAGVNVENLSRVGDKIENFDFAWD